MRPAWRSLCAFPLVLLALVPLAAIEAKGPPAGKGGGEPTVDHQAAQATPIQLGTSGGNAGDLANGYCCGGTLGSLIEVGGTRYILSNAHVFAGDWVTGGNASVSTELDPIIQPGLIDNACSAGGAAQNVASLHAWSNLKGSDNIDAAIAEVVPDMVDGYGSILEIGQVAAATLPAELNLAVKKSGRTSGLTQGTVAVLDATVTVGYSEECAGGSFTKTFTGQILVTPGKFISPGDSGSLMVEDVADLPRPVGLLFAGSRRVAVANPIDEVLSYFSDAQMVGAATTSAGAVAVDASRAHVRALQQRASAALLRVPGAQGHGIGLSSRHPGELAIKLLVERIDREAIEAAPREIDGVAVELLEVGRITAY